MRVLPERGHPDGQGIPGQESQGQRERNSGRNVARLVPLFHAHAHASSDQSAQDRRWRDEKAISRGERKIHDLQRGHDL